jgi:hypothetical protein
MLLQSILGESVSVAEKSENFSYSVTVQLKDGFPMTASDSSMGGDAEENRTLSSALIAAERGPGA